MGLFARWNALPVKARYYIGGSTFVFALVGDYVTTKLNEEVVARKDVMQKIEELNKSDNS